MPVYRTKLSSSPEKCEREARNHPNPLSSIWNRSKSRRAMFYAGRSHPEDFLRRVRSFDRDGTIVNTPTALAFNEIPALESVSIPANFHFSLLRYLGFSKDLEVTYIRFGDAWISIFVVFAISSLARYKPRMDLYDFVFYRYSDSKTWNNLYFLFLYIEFFTNFFFIIVTSFVKFCEFFISLYVNEIIPQGLFLLNPTWWTWFRDERRERIEIAFIKLIKKTDFCLVREYFFLTKIPSRVPHARFSHALYLFIIFYLFVYLFFSVSHSFFRRLKKISGHIRVDICTIAFIINLSTAFHTFSRCN